MEYEVSCYVALPKGSTESEKLLLEAVDAFEEAIRQSGVGFTLEVYSLREGRPVVRKIHPGDL